MKLAFSAIAAFVAKCTAENTSKGGFETWPQMGSRVIPGPSGAYVIAFGPTPASVTTTVSGITAGFCVGKAATNHQHDTYALDAGYYYTCAPSVGIDPLLYKCPEGDTHNGKEQLVYNPNTANADCSILSPGGYCDWAENVDFNNGNNGLDPYLTIERCMGEEPAELGNSGPACTTEARIGFCTSRAAGNYMHDCEDPENGYFYMCAHDDADDAIEMICPIGDLMNADGTYYKEQLVWNPNNGNSDCSIVSPGGFCDYKANVDFTVNDGLDANIDCVAAAVNEA